MEEAQTAADGAHTAAGPGEFDPWRTGREGKQATSCSSQTRQSAGEPPV